MKPAFLKRAKDNFLLCLLIALCIVLSPIIIPIFLIDEEMEDNYYRRLP